MTNYNYKDNQFNQFFKKSYIYGTGSRFQC